MNRSQLLIDVFGLDKCPFSALLREICGAGSTELDRHRELQRQREEAEAQTSRELLEKCRSPYAQSQRRKTAWN